MSDSQPLVSIVIPAYNRARRISRTLMSVIEQDYKNLEIIVVNDGSSDDTVNVSDQILSNSNRRYKIINNDSNKGKSFSRNAGIDASHGKYIWFCDSDDLAEKNFVSTLANKIEQDNTDMVFCGWKYWFEKEDKFKYEKTFVDSILSQEEYFKIWSSGKIDMISMWNCLFRKSFIVQNKIRYREGLVLAQDIDFMTRALVLSTRISLASGTYYIYVQYEENITEFSNRNKPKLHKYVFASRMYTRRFIIRHIHNEQVVKYALYGICVAILEMCRVCAFTGGREYFDYMLRKFRHKKIRDLMLSTIKFILLDHKLFCEAVMLIYFPEAYYRNTRARFVSDTILKYTKHYAKTGKLEDYNYIVKKFRHKKIRSVMLSTVKSIWYDPEPFFKSFLLMYFPNFYYKVRSKKS